MTNRAAIACAVNLSILYQTEKITRKSFQKGLAKVYYRSKNYSPAKWARVIAYHAAQKIHTIG